MKCAYNSELCTTVTQKRPASLGLLALLHGILDFVWFIKILAISCFVFTLQA